MPETRRRITKGNELRISYACPNLRCRNRFTITTDKITPQIKPTHCPQCGSNCSAPFAGIDKFQLHLDNPEKRVRGVYR